MKIVYPTHVPAKIRFGDIPEGTVFSNSVHIYRKLSVGQCYNLETLGVTTIDSKSTIYSYTPYPNATLILEPEVKA